MAAKKKAVGAGLAPDPSAVTPRLNLAETGFIGLRTMNGMVIEETNRVFRYPAFLKTVSEMRNDPTVASALNVYRMMINRVKWTVEPPTEATDQEKQRAMFVQSCMDDMESSWLQFISEVTTYLEYGFSVQEKVFRRRLTRNGSKFNDGYVGIRKIAPRSQDTIRHWNFSQDGRELESVGQSLMYLENGSRYAGLTNAKDGLITIDRSKFMLFSADSVKGNPEGKSILKSVYLPYKQMTMLKDQLLLGIAKDLSAIPIVGLPPKMMDVNADPADQAAYLAYQQLVNNVAAGTQRGIVMPLIYDEFGNKMFDFTLLEAKGQSKFDIPAAIKQLQNDILVALSCDVITFGPDMQGSFSIKDTKTNMLAMAVEHRLNEIRDVLNQDLMSQLYALNGWSQERMPTFEYGDIADVDSEAWSKAIQRMGAAGILEIDRTLLNKGRDVLGIAELSPDAPVDKEILSGFDSKAGEGMKPGTTGDGTSKVGGKSSGADRSSANSDNAA